MKRFRIHRNTYYDTDMFDAPPYVTLLERYYTYSVQMRILPFFWVTIREFDMASEKQSLWYAERLLKEIERF